MVKKEGKKAAKEAKQAGTGKNTRGRKRKSPTDADADAPVPHYKVTRMSETFQTMDYRMGWLSEEQQVAPVARMI